MTAERRTLAGLVARLRAALVRGRILGGRGRSPAFKLRHEPYIASVPAVLAGPVLLAAAAVLVVLAARGYSAALAGLILLAAVDLGWYGLSYSVYRSDSRHRRLEQYVASAATPPGNPDGRVVASLLRFDEPGLRTGDLMTLRGWRRADGYAGLEPRRQLDYRLLPALRVAGVRWVQRNPSTDRHRRAETVRRSLAGSARPVAARAAGHADANQQPPGRRHRAESAPTPRRLCEVPLALPASKPGTAVLAAERPGRLDDRRSIAPPRNCWSWPKAITTAGTPPSTASRRTLYRVNGDFMGCVVGPGKHRVVLGFQPDSLRARLADLVDWTGHVVRLFPRLLRPGRNPRHGRMICHERTFRDGMASATWPFRQLTSAGRRAKRRW